MRRFVAALGTVLALTAGITVATDIQPTDTANAVVAHRKMCFNPWSRVFWFIHKYHPC